MRPRIVLATDSQDPSGMGEHMLVLGSVLASDFDVVIAAPGQDDLSLLPRAAQLGLRVKRLEPEEPELFRHWLTSLGATLIHVHAGIGWEGHDLVRAGRGAGIPVVRTEHLPYLITSVVQQAEYRAMLLSVDRRIAVSQTVADSHLGRGGGRLDVIANGIVPKAAARTREDTRAALGLRANEPVILNVARLAPQKGHDALLRAIPDVLHALPDARFLLVGSGPQEETVRRSIAELELTESVMALGSRPDVPDLLAAADLFVLPSKFEGLPLVVLEAMASSLPVVATAIGGSVEALGAEHPLLVPSGDAEALAHKIIGALVDPGSARTAAEAARDRFAAKFTGERMARETAAIYRSLIRMPTPQGAIA